jgi:steroid delta-isomerase-like uncharacterized protein
MVEIDHRSEPEAIVRRFIEDSFSEGQLDLVDELVADEYVGYDSGTPEPIRGPAELKRTMETYLSAFPDLEFTIHDVACEDDLVAVRWTATGTHEGELMGIEPTGERVENAGMEFDRVRDGQVVETHVVWDALGMLRQLGVVPDERVA